VWKKGKRWKPTGFCKAAEASWERGEDVAEFKEDGGVTVYLASLACRD
jgi:hypothetical protein